MAPVERHAQFPLLLQSCNRGAIVVRAVEVAHAASHGEAAVLDARRRSRRRRFGKLFIANPDLPPRIALNAPLNRWNSAILLAGEEGYSDYPELAEPAE